MTHYITVSVTIDYTSQYFAEENENKIILPYKTVRKIASNLTTLYYDDLLEMPKHFEDLIEYDIDKDNFYFIKRACGLNNYRITNIPKNVSNIHDEDIALGQMQLYCIDDNTILSRANFFLTRNPFTHEISIQNIETLEIEKIDKTFIMKGYYNGTQDLHSIEILT